MSVYICYFCGEVTRKSDAPCKCDPNDLRNCFPMTQTQVDEAFSKPGSHCKLQAPANRSER